MINHGRAIAKRGLNARRGRRGSRMDVRYRRVLSDAHGTNAHCDHRRVTQAERALHDDEAASHSGRHAIALLLRG